ncbi:MAG: hypothetical protein ACJ72J_11835, partial [Nitrososphaeraceae archaeon]
MPSKLSTTISKISTIPNSTNSSLITEFHTYMKMNGASERHQNNSLKVCNAFALSLGLDTKIKSQEQDPDKKWITTWNYNLVHLKRFFRWLHNHHKDEQESNDIAESEWKTPSFINIKKRRTKRLSPYSENEIWEREELLSIVKYEPYARNKAALTLFWDLDARNHEITLLKIKNIRLRENYGEGDIPYQAKTGSGPILLTCSFPYVRDWF